MIPIVRKACDAAGGIQKLADELGIKRQAFYQWPKVPPERVLPMERATGGKVTRHDMRPDLYPADDGVRNFQANELSPVPA